MATVLITCDGYKTIREVPDDADLPMLCSLEEMRRDDGFAVFASRDGRRIADADGWTEGDGFNADAATATGMYDGW